MSATVLTSIDDLENIVSAALTSLRRSGYTANSIIAHRSIWNMYKKFAKQKRFRNKLSPKLVCKFLQSRDVPLDEPLHQLCPQHQHERASMKMLCDFANGGSFRRQYGAVKKSRLKRKMSNLLLEYQAFLREVQKNADSTIANRCNYVVKFLCHLESLGLRKLSTISNEMVERFLREYAQQHRASANNMFISLRSFFRFLFATGKTATDLRLLVPSIPNQSSYVPLVWTDDEVVSMLSAVDRASPVGIRDYAVLVLAVQLGLRPGDILTLKLDNIDWERGQISIVQSKTGEPLSLPLPDDVAMALIDYLQHARRQCDYREIFVTLTAPIRPLITRSTLDSILIKYRRRAGIRLKSGRRFGIKTLRHTVATRLLKNGVSLETISGILGHGSLETTRLYTKVDIDGLRSVALDPDEVMR
jgi:integrase/recombinase XerD